MKASRCFQISTEELQFYEKNGLWKGKKIKDGRTDYLEEDSYAQLKYDTTAGQDGMIIRRVMGLAAKHGVSMTEFFLAWLLTKVTAPVVGATKPHHIERAAKAVDLILSEEEAAYLEESYVPHVFVGVMAQNTMAAAKKSAESLTEAAEADDFVK